MMRMNSRQYLIIDEPVNNIPHSVHREVESIIYEVTDRYTGHSDDPLTRERIHNEIFAGVDDIIKRNGLPGTVQDYEIDIGSTTSTAPIPTITLKPQQSGVSSLILDTSYYGALGQPYAISTPATPANSVTPPELEDQPTNMSTTRTALTLKEYITYKATNSDIIKIESFIDIGALRSMGKESGLQLYPQLMQKTFRTSLDLHWRDSTFFNTFVDGVLDKALPNWRSYFEADSYEPDAKISVLHKLVELLISSTVHAHHFGASDTAYDLSTLRSSIGRDVLYILISIIAISSDYSLREDELNELNIIAGRYLSVT